jgi:hypothetical protein
MINNTLALSIISISCFGGEYRSVEVDCSELLFELGLHSHEGLPYKLHYKFHNELEMHPIIQLYEEL